MIRKILCLTWWKGTMQGFFSKKSEIRDLDNTNLYEKSKLKAFDILLECERSEEKIKKFFLKEF